MRKTIGIFTKIFALILIVLTSLLYGVRLLGFTPYVINDKEMEPTYRQGSIIYVVKSDFEDIKINNEITYVKNEQLEIKTSRVVDIDETMQLFTLKSDASEENEDKLLHYNNVLGIVKYYLPLLGYFAKFLKIELVSKVLIGLIILATLFYLAKIQIKSERKKLRK